MSSAMWLSGDGQRQVVLRRKKWKRFLTTPCLLLSFCFRRGWQNYVASGLHLAFIGRLLDILQSVNNEYDLLLCWQINCWQGWLSNNYDSITPLTSLEPNMLYATTAIILPDMTCMQKDGRKKLCAKFRCSRILLLPDTKTLS